MTETTGEGLHPESRKTGFEEQFNKRLEGKTENGSFQYVHIKPENPVGEPLIFHQGWLANIEACKPIIEEAYHLKQEIFVPDLIGHAPPETTGDEAYDRYTFRNAQALAQIVKDNGLEKINLAGHSEGTSVALTAAELLHNEGIEVENIVLVNPTGFGLNPERGMRTKAELVKRGAKMVWQEFIRGKNSKVKPPKAELDIKHLLHHPVHTSKEGLVIANVDMVKLTEDVISQGINVSILQSEDDPFVKHEDLNTEFQLASQAVRRAEIAKVLAETQGMNDAQRQEKVTNRREELEKQEEQRIISTAIGNPGHIFAGHHPKTFMQTVVPLIRKTA